MNEDLQFAIKILSADIEQMGYTPVVQFELEGVSKPAADRTLKPDMHHLNFNAINAELKHRGILGLLKPEYWQNQWEYASMMAGQTPLKAAKDLDTVILLLPTLLKLFGSQEVFIQPVYWDSNSSNRPLLEKDNAKMIEGKAVHIPNSVQFNVSAFDRNGKNLLSEDGLGQTLHQCFLQTSYECCLLYCPEQPAFARYTLKDQYDLHKELSSPVDISSSHMGGVLFHQDKDKNGKPIDDWQRHSRIEHRLGAASTKYNAYLNCVYALANLHEAILISRGENSLLEKNGDYTRTLPTSLHGQRGAFEVFRQGRWFEQKLNQLKLSTAEKNSLHKPLGTLLKQSLLQRVN